MGFSFLVGTTQVNLTKSQIKKKERTLPNFMWKYRLTVAIILLCQKYKGEINGNIRNKAKGRITYNKCQETDTTEKKRKKSVQFFFSSFLKSMIVKEPALLLIGGFSLWRRG